MGYKPQISNVYQFPKKPKKTEKLKYAAIGVLCILAVEVIALGVLLWLM